MKTKKLKCLDCKTTKEEVKPYWTSDFSVPQPMLFCAPCFQKYSKAQFEKHEETEPDYDKKS